MLRMKLLRTISSSTAFNFYCLPDGGDKTCCERIVRKAKEQAAFSNTCTIKSTRSKYMHILRKVGLAPLDNRTMQEDVPQNLAGSFSCG